MDQTQDRVKKKVKDHHEEIDHKIHRKQDQVISRLVVAKDLLKMMMQQMATTSIINNP
jgi:hypothetical protein